MRRFLCVLVFAALSACAPPTGSTSPASAPETKEPGLVGVWKLVTYRDTPEGGLAVEAFGANPIGQFIFTADGQASISIMRNPPASDPEARDPDPDSCEPQWYCSYFGSYSLDEGAGTWSVHVQGGNVRNFIGTTQQRNFRIEGDKLVLESDYDSAGRKVHAERVLERVR